MQKLKFRKCELCNKSGNFTINKLKYCGDHKPNDAKIQKTKCEKCNKEATRGPVFGSLLRCITHTKKNYVTKHRINPKCNADKCKNKPIFGLAGSNIPEYCENHKIDNMVNIIEKKCVSCKLQYLIPEGMELCIFCYDGIKIIKQKEDRIKNVLDAKGIKYDSYNKVIDNRCNNKRPDFVIDYNTFFVVIEVDENQHKSYPKECELTRMKQIHQSLGMDTLFIRFNPDSYIDIEGKKINSYGGRENKLIKLLTIIKNVVKLDHYLSVIYLFYDGYDGKNTVQKIEY